MPNHVHVLLYFPEMSTSLNTVIANAKGFLAYDTIKRLQEKKASNLLDTLHAGVKKRESKKGQIQMFSIWLRGLPSHKARAMKTRADGYTGDPSAPQRTTTSKSNSTVKNY